MVNARALSRSAAGSPCQQPWLARKPRLGACSSSSAPALGTERALGQRYRAVVMASSFADATGVFVLGDTTFPKAGSHSVDVQREDCGALGKKANCQAAVNLHYVGKAGHVPLSLRLFLPESWLEAPGRLDKAGVPEAERRALSKGEIALDSLDAVRAGNVLPGRVSRGR